MKCNQCGTEYSGESCPACAGIPKKEKKPIFKKWWFWAIVIVVIAIIASSGSDKPTKESHNSGITSESSQTTTTDTTFGISETAVFDDIKITAVEMQESKGANYFEPEAGNVFVGVKFEIENISDAEQNISSLLLFDGYADGVKCDYSISANCAFNDGTLDGELSPGRKMIGYYAVEIPEDWEKLEFEVKSDWLSSSKATFVFEK